MSSNSINGIEDEQIYHFLPKAVRDGGFARAYNPIIPGERGIPMGNAHEYLMPDYYPDFHCKTGMCRAACCVGWNVSLSMQDYFRLLGVECRKHVREKLDCALHVKRYPTEDSYAELVHRYDGNCPLRMENGLCAIHAEAGEQALPAICRLYPRAIRAEGDFECSCAASCERVVEMLLDSGRPVRFVRRSLIQDVPESAGRSVFFETVPREQEIRMKLIGVMQDQTRSLTHRLLRMERALDILAADWKAGRIDEFLARSEDELAEFEAMEVREEHLLNGLQCVKEIIEQTTENSPSLHDYAETCLALFEGAENPLESYRRANAHFEAIFPNWEQGYENLLVNHMFFSRYPFADMGGGLRGEFVALCAVYTMMRFFGVCWMADKEDEAALVDVLAALFRLIDHTRFHRRAERILTEIGCDTPERLQEIMNL